MSPGDASVASAPPAQAVATVTLSGLAHTPAVSPLTNGVEVSVTVTGAVALTAALLSPGQPIYVMLYAGAIVFFCFFYTALVFNSRETADNLKKSGAFIPGIRPGDQTARHIDRILSRLTLAGAIYITAVCLLPEFLVLKYNVPFYFGGTSLLIVVGVAMDTVNQIEAQLIMRHYEGFTPRAGRIRGRRSTF